MPDREKVIGGLTCRYENKLGKDCEHCHYGMTMGRRWGCDFVRMSGDALALLKVQEPRVMTLAEVEQWEQPDVWMEKKDGEPDPCGDYLMPMTRMEFAFWYAIVVGDTNKRPPTTNGEYYGKTWRCWSARPTDAQREATPWEP